MALFSFCKGIVLTSLWFLLLRTDEAKNDTRSIGNLFNERFSHGRYFLSIRNVVKVLPYLSIAECKN